MNFPVTNTQPLSDANQWWGSYTIAWQSTSDPSTRDMHYAPPDFFKHVPVEYDESDTQKRYTYVDSWNYYMYYIPNAQWDWYIYLHLA